MLAAALISARRVSALGMLRKWTQWELAALANDDLAYVSIARAMGVGEKGRESRDGDVSLQEVEFRDAVPYLALGWELRTCLVKG